MGVQLVWLKKDLRVADHPPLLQAVAAGPTVVLFVHEPGYWSRPEHHPAQLRFATQGLDAVDSTLRRRGNRLVQRTGRILDVLDALHATLGIDHLRSHAEVGLGWTFGRDRAVRRWVDAQGIPWTETLPAGWERAGPGREGWSRRWEARMAAPPRPAPEQIPPPDWPEGFSFGRSPTPEVLGMTGEMPEAVEGGEPEAHALLASFLTERGRDYRQAMSSPVAGWGACSRLAPHLAWGTLSLRTAWHATRGRLDVLRARVRTPGGPDPRWIQSLEAFESRLRWRDHFTQKLEDTPSIEFRNLHPGYDGLRIEDTARWTAHHRARFAAWAEGRTGLPMVDACMRCLHAGGWLNFRMRAMLVSVATHHLWLHWRPVAVHLARHFLDFEPGIHFPQVQMQAGTTGINSLRVYDPAKQARDQDPDGVFIRRWVPELARVPTEHLAEPWRMPEAVRRAIGLDLGTDYPEPIVDTRRAAVLAKRRFAEVRRRADVRAEARRVHERHGSRRGPMRRRRS